MNELPNDRTNSANGTILYRAELRWQAALLKYGNWVAPKAGGPPKMGGLGPPSAVPPSGQRGR
eukprot:4275822-Pyramimonas_sp.AAC.1